MTVVAPAGIGDWVSQIVLDSGLGQDYRIGVFGSRISGQPGKFSDLDVVISGPGPVSGQVLERVKQAFEDSNLPFRADVVDLNGVSEVIRKQIMAEAVWL